MFLMRMLASVLSPGGANGGLSILIFHRVLAAPDNLFPDEPDARRFAEILGWVGRDFNVVPLATGVAELLAGKLPPRALAITFDDGYADNYTVALPVLQRFGMHATFFVASSFLDGGRMWNDTIIESIRKCPSERLHLDELGAFDLSSDVARRRAIDSLLPALKYLAPAERLERVEWISERSGVSPSDDLMMSSNQLRSLHLAGMAVGGHTRTHPILARLHDDAARQEIEGGKADLEAIIGQRLTLFAYPNGKPDTDYDARHAAMVRNAGFETAVSTAPGIARPTSDCLQLPRFTPWDRTELRFGMRLVSNMTAKVQVAS